MSDAMQLARKKVDAIRTLEERLAACGENRWCTISEEAIRQVLDANGKEVFDESKNAKLPDDVEHMFPDYSIYPEFSYAVSMTSRGCPRGCAFC